MTENEHKIKTATEWLDAGVLSVYLDPRQPGVKGPPQLLDQNVLILNFSPRFDTAPIVNEWGIRQTLKFVQFGGHVPCAVPWSAVLALKSEKLGLAVPYTPPSAVTEPHDPETGELEPDPPGTIRRGHLRLVS